MDDKLIIGKWEAVFMLVNIISLKALTVYPSFLSTLSGSGSWLAAVCGSLLAIFITWIIVLLYRKYTDFNYAELIERRFGSFAANIIVVFAVLSMLATFSFFVDFIANSLSVTHFSSTPKWLLCLVLIIPAMHGAYKGVGASIRITALSAMGMIVFFVVTFLSVMSDTNVSSMYPVFGYDYNSFFKGVMLSISLFSDFFLLLFIMPNIEKKKDISFVWKGALFISAAIFILTVIMVQTSFMPEGYSSVSAVDRAEAYVKIGRFYARTERLFSVMWLISYICSFSVYFSLITHFTHSVTALDRRAIIIIAGIIIFVTSVSSVWLADVVIWLSFGWLALPVLTSFKRKELKK